MRSNIGHHLFFWDNSLNIFREEKFLIKYESHVYEQKKWGFDYSSFILQLYKWQTMKKEREENVPTCDNWLLVWVWAKITPTFDCVVVQVRDHPSTCSPVVHLREHPLFKPIVNKCIEHFLFIKFTHKCSQTLGLLTHNSHSNPTTSLMAFILLVALSYYL